MPERTVHPLGGRCAVAGEQNYAAEAIVVEVGDSCGCLHAAGVAGARWQSSQCREERQKQRGPQVPPHLGLTRPRAKAEYLTQEQLSVPRINRPTRTVIRAGACTSSTATEISVVFSSTSVSKTRSDEEVTTATVLDGVAICPV